MKSIHKKALAVGAVVLVVPGLLMASLFDGLVWDIPQELNSARQLVQEIQMVSNMIQQVQMMQYSIRAFPTRLKTSFQGFTQSFYRPNTGSLFGETADWANLMNTSSHSYGAVQNAWQKSGIAARPSSLFQNNLVNSTGLNSLAHTEIADAAGINAVQTVNAVRDQQALNERAIQQLQQSCLSEDNDTAAMQSNCATASGLLNAQTGQTTNALLTAVVDVATAQMKPMRDQEALRVNRESRSRDYLATEQTNGTLLSESMKNFKFQF